MKIYISYIVVLLVVFISIGCKCVKDIDGNEYEVIKIGNQEWLSKNLEVTKFNDGTTIPLVSNNTNWSQATTSAGCWYDNKLNNDYGMLYNVQTIANSKNVCPTDWKVPSMSDWNALVSYLGDSKPDGMKLMETGTTHWENAYNSTNESRFTALGSGQRIGNGRYTNLKKQAAWWVSESTPTNRSIYSIDMGKAGSGVAGVNSGLAIRCIKE